MCGVLLLNLLVAAVVAVRRHRSSWLLVVLLAGTVGAAVAAILAVLDGDNTRYLDVALVLTGTAAVTAVVRLAVRPAHADTPDAGKHAASAGGTSRVQGPV